MNKEKLMTDIDTDKLALISDSPFLMCVFYVPSNDRNDILMKPRAIRNKRTDFEVAL